MKHIKLFEQFCSSLNEGTATIEIVWDPYEVSNIADFKNDLKKLKISQKKIKAGNPQYDVGDIYHFTGPKKNLQLFLDDWYSGDVEDHLAESLNEARSSALRSGTNVTVASVNYGSEGVFDTIKLTNGFKITAGEDSGGEWAFFELDGTKLKKGDSISFSINLGDGDTYFDEGNIIINGKSHMLKISSEGGNISTVINYSK